MPSWGEVLDTLNNSESPIDMMRRKYLRIMNQYTGRNVIAYYSAFIQKPNLDGTSIDDNDKNAFMQAVCGLDRGKGLDLILHTPGGAIAATESIVYYLRKLFGNDIRAFIPQMAMSAGTMIALSCNQIIMGRQSNLGPIDPQYGGMSCAGIIEEFNQAIEDVTNNPAAANIWELIIGKYHPTFIGDCEKAINWADSMVKKWLANNMFSAYLDKEERANKVLETLSSHNRTYSHSRHIHIDELKDLGLEIIELEGFDDRPIEDCKDFQDCILTLHHSYMQALSTTDVIKMVENHNGEAMIMGIKSEL